MRYNINNNQKNKINEISTNQEQQQYERIIKYKQIKPGAQKINR